MQFDDPAIVTCIDLDPVSCDPNFEPPGKIGDLLQPINRELCQGVRLVQTTDGSWLLQWEERHPEMVSREEHLVDRDWRDEEVLDEYRRLEEIMPPQSFEIPITRRQAFALVVSCAETNEFEDEVASLLE